MYLFPKSALILSLATLLFSPWAFSETALSSHSNKSGSQHDHEHNHISSIEGNNHSHENEEDENPHRQDHEHGQEQGNNEHQHQDELFPVESFLLTFKGTQPFGEDCYLGVIEEGTNEEGVFYAKVETSFAHGASGPGQILVSPSELKPNILEGTTLDGSRISIELDSIGAKISNSLAYAVRWKHEGHFDSGVCKSLSLVHKSEDEEDGIPEDQLPKVCQQNNK